MFAFAIFDNKKKKLTLIRDAFGIKPLFFCVNGTSLSFCSELSPILKIENCKFKLNLQNIYDYLVYSRYDHNHFTFFENICHLLPGHYIAFDLENINLAKQRAWWEPDTKEKKISYLKATKKLKSLFLESINLHLRSDVNIGVMLSGGIDSSSIVSAIKFLNPKEPVTTFSYISSTQNISEEKYIDYINKNFKTTSYKIKGEKFHINTTDFDNLISKQGEPFGGPSICASYILYKMIKKIGVKVIAQFFKSFILKRGLLDGKTGFTISRLSANATYRKYIKLLHLQKSK
jgi:asparagine synthase (glutamine-hydrolysing)